MEVLKVHPEDRDMSEWHAEGGAVIITRASVSPEVPVVEPRLVFEVKLLQVLQRNALLLLAAAVQQPLHAALQNINTELRSEVSQR